MTVYKEAGPHHCISRLAGRFKTSRGKVCHGSRPLGQHNSASSARVSQNLIPLASEEMLPPMCQKRGLVSQLHWIVTKDARGVTATESFRSGLKFTWWKLPEILKTKYHLIHDLWCHTLGSKEFNHSLLSRCSDENIHDTCIYLSIWSLWRQMQLWQQGKPWRQVSSAGTKEY